MLSKLALPGCGCLAHDTAPAGIRALPWKGLHEPIVLHSIPCFLQCDQFGLDAALLRLDLFITLLPPA